jgi:hypothetical protein
VRSIAAVDASEATARGGRQGTPAFELRRAIENGVITADTAVVVLSDLAEIGPGNRRDVLALSRKPTIRVGRCIG